MSMSMTRTPGTTNLGPILAITAAAALGIAACSQSSVAGNGVVAQDDTGILVAALTLAPGLTLDTASYAITGPSGFTRTGTINVANSSTLSTTIGGLPAGNGFSISITATATEGTTTCGGSAMFDVTARMTTAVMVHVTCHEAPRAGSISATGTINICPVVDGISANPAQVVVGAPIVLSVAAHDSDAGPAALSYRWSVGSGAFSDAAAASPTFTCNVPGTVTITVTASDGDATPGCASSGSVQVRCSLPGAGGTAASTMAVYGDAPYGTTPTDNSQTLATPAFIASVNADADVSLVLHVGDIHSGKQFCTQAYDQTVFNLWTAFVDPLVYTPGDNEWSDCHKVAQGGGAYNPTTMMIDYVLDPMTMMPVDYAKGDPIANLALVRSLFFATPGQSLGTNKIQVLSQVYQRCVSIPGISRTRPFSRKDPSPKPRSARSGASLRVLVTVWNSTGRY